MEFSWYYLYQRILLGQHGFVSKWGNNDRESRWRGCGFGTLLEVFFQDSRCIFQIVTKIRMKKYWIFDENFSQRQFSVFLCVDFLDFIIRERDMSIVPSYFVNKEGGHNYFILKEQFRLIFFSMVPFALQRINGKSVPNKIWILILTSQIYHIS